MYQSIVKSRIVSQLITGTGALDALPAITLLRKLCNHPHLVADDMHKWQEPSIDSKALETAEIQLDSLMSGQAEIHDESSTSVGVTPD